MADPNAADPVARESTRLTCVATKGGQTTMDVNWWKAHVPGYTEPHRDFKDNFAAKTDEEYLEKALDVSALSLISADDPPIFMTYGMAPGAPIPSENPQGWKVHHVAFGVALKEKTDTLGVEAHLAYPGVTPRYGAIGEFLVAKLTAERPAESANATRPERAEARPSPPRNPHNIAPTAADYRYGPHERNVFDFWQAKSDQPTPVLVSIHGGGFRAGDKEGAKFGSRVPECLADGIAYASINYRLSIHAPYPAQMLDAARALQTIRSKAKEWNIDPKRIAVTGGSAGAGISLWLSFHDDLADPNSNDPIARQSTRTVCALVNNSQSTYDARIMDKIVLGGLIQNGKKREEAILHGLPEDFDWINGTLTDEQEALIRDSAPVNHLTKDDPPVYLIYSDHVNVPGNVHHPNFGRHLKTEMDALGIECVFHMDSDFRAPGWSGESGMDFVKRHFGMK
jgi:hypothetical protein